MEEHLDRLRQEHEQLPEAFRNHLNRSRRGAQTPAEEAHQRAHEEHLMSLLRETTTMNGQPPNPPAAPVGQGLGPMRTRVHETVGADGSRTRVVVSESSFEMSRQATPDLRAAQTDPQVTAAQDTPWLRTFPMNATTNRSNGSSGPLPPAFPQNLTQRFGATANPAIPPMFLPPPQAAAPLRSQQDARLNPIGWADTTTAYLLSGPDGPHALVFSPGQGVYTTVPPQNGPATSGSATTFPRSRTGRRSPNTNNTRNRQQIVDNSRGPVPGRANATGPTAPQAPGRPRNRAPARLANPDPVLRIHFHRNIVQPIWTFIKLSVAVIMFTGPGTRWRKLLIFVAFVISVMPPSNLLQNTLRRVQAHVDGLLGPPPPPTRQAAVPPTPGPNAQPLNAGNNGAPVTQGPAGTGNAHAHASTTAGVQSNANTAHGQTVLERIEQGLGLFMASLVPGIGERHVRAREEARREEARQEAERQEQARQEEVRREEARKTAATNSGAIANEQKDGPGSEGNEAPTSASQAQDGPSGTS